MILTKSTWGLKSGGQPHFRQLALWSLFMKLANVRYHSVLSESVGAELLPYVCFLQFSLLRQEGKGEREKRESQRKREDRERERG